MAKIHDRVNAESADIPSVWKEIDMYTLIQICLSKKK